MRFIYLTISMSDILFFELVYNCEHALISQWRKLSVWSISHCIQICDSFLRNLKTSHREHINAYKTVFELMTSRVSIGCLFSVAKKSTFLVLWKKTPRLKPIQWLCFVFYYGVLRQWKLVTVNSGDNCVFAVLF
jgi:hypothetical protein